MPKLTRLTSQYVRRELLGLFRRKYLPLLVRHICRQPTDGSTWPALAVPFDVESLRPMFEALEALPRARIQRKPESPLRKYQKELTIWKRRRTTARARVAKYTRLVRYHAKPRKKTGGGVTQRTLIGGVPGGMSCRGSVRAARPGGSIYS